MGLLRDVERKGGRVLYQLTALTFKHAYGLITTDGVDEHTTTIINRLGTSFLTAYARSERRADGLEAEWVVFDFSSSKDQPTKVLGEGDIASEPRPAHLQTRTLSLSAAAYQTFIRRVAQLLEKVEGEKTGDGTCTLAFLAMDGPLQDGARDSRIVSSFVPRPQLGAA